FCTSVVVFVSIFYCSVFISMVRTLLSTSLLPYTTLFRSTGKDARSLVRNGVVAVGEGANMPCTPDTVAAFREAGILFGPAKAAKDRKSTRLNSSHVKISYAVFCLKKRIYSV